MGLEEAQGWAAEARSQTQLLCLLTQRWSGAGALLEPQAIPWSPSGKKTALLRGDEAQGVRSEHFYPLP